VHRDRSARARAFLAVSSVIEMFVPAFTKTLE